MRELVQKAIGESEWIGLSTSGAGAGGGTTVVDTALTGKDADFCADWYTILPSGPSGSGSYETRRNASFVTATITLDEAASAQVASGITFDLSRYNPLLIHDAINKAIEIAFPRLYVPKRDETLLVDNILLNSDFQSAVSGGSSPSWTNTGSPTLADETNVVWHGSQSLKVTSHSSNNAQIRQSIFGSPVYHSIRGIMGKQVIFKAWVYATGASEVKLGIYDGSAVTYGNYHTGNDGWELLEVTHTTVAGNTDVAAELFVASGSNVAYFNASSFTIEPIFRYTIPSALIRGPYSVSVQRDIYHPEGPYDEVLGWDLEEDGETKYIYLQSKLTTGRRLRLEGQGVLSAYTSDTGTTEISTPRRQTLVECAAWLLMEALSSDAVGEQRNDYLVEAQKHERLYRELLTQPGMTNLRRGVTSRRKWVST